MSCGWRGERGALPRGTEGPHWGMGGVSTVGLFAATGPAKSSDQIVSIFGLRLVVRDSRCLRRHTLLSSDGPYCGPQAGTSLSLTGSMGLLLTSETWIDTPLIFSTACCKRGMVSLKTE